MKKQNIIIIAMALILMPLAVSAGNSTESGGLAITKSTQDGNKVFLSPAAGEQIDWQVLSNGGGKGSSANFMVNATLSQTAVGTSSSTNFILGHGFWKESGGAGGCCVIRGDVATPADGNVLVNDLVFMVDYLFKGGSAPDCLDAGDVATPLDGNILVDDLVYLVDYLFKGGAAPPAC